MFFQFRTRGWTTQFNPVRQDDNTVPPAPVQFENKAEVCLFMYVF